MNVSYQWLKAVLPELTTSPEETAEILALRGAPVEEMVHLAPGLDDLVVARVEAVEFDWVRASKMRLLRPRLSKSVS